LDPQTDYIFGIRAIEEAIKSGKEIDKIFIRKGLSGDLFQAFFTLVRENNVPFQYVPPEKLDRITRKNHQGVIAFLSSITYQNIESIIPTLYEEGKTPFILILDGITDVRNMGAIARSAECSGAHAIIIPEKGSAQINADAIKTSAGALHHIPVCRVKSLSAALKFLKESGLFVAAATEKANEIYFHTDFNKPLAIILGSEESGISDELLKRSDVLIKIPLLGNIGSLNVSAAASAIVFEIVRQRVTPTS
jgi:23S rRNA (guanosine2251-2'-O)-methyltransferase